MIGIIIEENVYNYGRPLTGNKLQVKGHMGQGQRSRASSEFLYFSPPVVG